MKNRNAALIKISLVFLLTLVIFPINFFHTEAASNLITNPGMETASSNPSLPLSWAKGGYGTNTRSLTYPATGQSGGKGAKVEITSYTSGDAKWFFDPVSVSGGQELSFTDFYQSTTQSFVDIQYQLQDGTFRWEDIAILPEASSWAQFTKTFTVPTSYSSPVSKMTIFHLINSVGSITTDNYSLIDNTPPVEPTGTIKVNIVVINDDDGTKSASDFTPAVDTKGVMAGVATTFPVGAHVVSETLDSNYTTTISGDCDENGNVTLAEGDNKVCTITNDDIRAVPPVPSNMISNHSVETPSSNPSIPLSWAKGGYGVNTRNLTYNNDSQDGSKGVKAEITSYTSGDAKWFFDPVPVSGGQKFSYSQYYKSNTVTEIDIRYQLQDGSFKYAVPVSKLPASPDWNNVSFTFTVPTNYSSPVVNMTVLHIIYSVGWLSTDNYSLTTYIPPSADPNVILNPSVETVSNTNSSFPEYWSRYSASGSTTTFTYPVAGYNSSKALQVEITNYTGGSGAKWYFQSIPVTPGDDYAFSDYFKSTIPSYLNVQFELDNGTFKYLDLTPLAPSANWKEATGRFTVPPNAISLTITHLIKDVGTLTTDNFVLKKLPPGAFTRGMITLSFDDSLTSIYQNGMPILNSAGIKTTQNVITGRLNENGYWTTSELSNVSNWGHNIASHTRNHLHLTQLSASELQSEIAGSKSDLINLGYNPQTLAYPFGDYNDVVVQALKNAGYIGARSIHSAFNTKNSDPFALNVEHVESNTTIAQIKSWIDEAIADKVWLILEIHDIDHSGTQYSTTPEILQQIVDYINATNIQVVDTTEGLAKLNY
ncbi:MAG TPA: polysaccharide deacetylase family protein [Candidatus Paceibacterota bacterium]|nr:polysaccharide deacetylase family protein [Candidatus Paceibacterota bacterium]